LGLLSRDLHVQCVGAQVEIVAPRNLSPRANVDRFEVLVVLPGYKYALANQVRQVDLADDAICVPNPQSVSWQCSYFNWLQHF